MLVRDRLLGTLMDNFNTTDSYLSEKESERYFRVLESLSKFSELFDYREKSDRAIAIIGPAFLDLLLGSILTEFLVDDEEEVNRLLQPEGPLSTYGGRVTACYCLGLIGEIVKSDLRLVGKIRNRFAHDLDAGFSDPKVGGWCGALRFHKEFFAVPPSDATDRDLFQVGINQLASHLQGVVGIARTEKRKQVLYT
jgi:DNA-binding MltR family transcriptional regulator